jgi:hypothetical protein
VAGYSARKPGGQLNAADAAHDDIHDGGVRRESRAAWACSPAQADRASWPFSRRKTASVSAAS